jgi:acyl-homoserine lactone synthase
MMQQGEWMVDVVTSENAHLYRDALENMFRMRYRVAVEQWGWNIPGIEPGYDKDKYDTEETVYFICFDASESQVLACSRINPTVKPHLLSDVFADRCVCGPVPTSKTIFELSRYIVDHRAMSKEDQMAVRGRIVSAVNQFCLQAGITHVTFLSYMSSYARTIKYWETRPLGEPCYFEEDDATYIAAISAMTPSGLENLRNGFHLKNYEPHISTRTDWNNQPAISRIRKVMQGEKTAA